jgi:hypothetical protein
LNRIDGENIPNLILLLLTTDSSLQTLKADTSVPRDKSGDQGSIPGRRWSLSL